MQTHSLLTHTPDGHPYYLHYKIWGEDNPKTRTLVCVHGLTGNSGDFKFLGEYLARENNLRVVAIDMAGRNESADYKNPNDYCFRQYLNDLHLLLKEIDCSSPASVDWLGVSMGGLLGIRMSGEYNSPVRNLILIDIGPEAPHSDLEYIAQFITTEAAYLNPEQLVPLLKMALGSPYSRGPMNEEQWLHLAKTYLRKDTDGLYKRNMDAKIADMFRKEPLGEIPLWPVWEAVKQPALVVRGELSTIFPKHIAKEMEFSKTGEKMELHTWQDCGHVPSLYPDDQISIIGKWLTAKLLEEESALA